MPPSTNSSRLMMASPWKDSEAPWDECDPRETSLGSNGTATTATSASSSSVATARGSSLFRAVLEDTNDSPLRYLSSSSSEEEEEYHYAGYTNESITYDEALLDTPPQQSSQAQEVVYDEPKPQEAQQQQQPEAPLAGSPEQHSTVEQSTVRFASPLTSVAPPQTPEIPTTTTTTTSTSESSCQTEPETMPQQPLHNSTTLNAVVQQLDHSSMTESQERPLKQASSSDRLSLHLQRQQTLPLQPTSILPSEQWRKLGQAKRRRMLEQDRRQGGLNFQLNVSCSIDRYYQVARRVCTYME